MSTTIATVDESIMKTNDTVVPLNSTEQVIDSFYFYEVSLLLCYVESLFFIRDGNTKSLANYDQNKNIFCEWLTQLDRYEVFFCWEVI